MHFASFKPLKPHAIGMKTNSNGRCLVDGTKIEGGRNRKKGEKRRWRKKGD